MRLHPSALMWLCPAIASVRSDDVEWQQQHFGFVGFTRERWVLSQQEPQQQEPFAPLQQQPFVPSQMPRQNSLRCPFGQTH